MKITIKNFKRDGVDLTFDKCEKIAEVGVAGLTMPTKGVVIYLETDYAIDKGVSYLQFINRADFSRIEIH